MTFHLYCRLCKRWNIGWGKVLRCCGELMEVVSRDGEY